MSENLKQRVALSAERRALLELRLKEKRRTSTSRQQITRGERTDVYPLSFEQERLWFLHLLEPNTLMHNLNRISMLDGPLDVTALQKSFDEVVRRHEILRTTLTLVDERPVQVVQPVRSGMLPLIDLLALPPEQREARADELAAEQARSPFDMAQRPLMRAALLRLSEEKHALVLTLHHVITDWWSFGVLNRELLTLYQAFSSGGLSPLPELKIQYGDYARWQREWLQGKELETLVSYWKQQLSDCPQLLNLPTDRPRPKEQTFRGKRLRFELPKELYRSLEDLSHAEEVTPFVTALAVFQVLLYRYTAQEQILVGTPSANRSKLETEGLIGFLLNTLVLRGDLTGDPTFRELLKRLRGIVFGAYAHQDLPFQKLVEELKTERNLNVMPLVQACFIFLSTQSPNLDAAIPQLPLPELHGLSVQLSNVTTIASEFDLTLSLENRPEFLDGFFEYNTELFDEATIARMIGHLRTVMEAVLANPDQRISQLPLLTAEERHGLLSSAGVTTAAATYQPVHLSFESQAEKNPEAIAVTREEEWVTYRELNERANKLAHYLMRLGVGPETPVGILLERSVEMVVALLAVFKAGGVYVPLDTSHPAERWALILADTKAHFLLTQEKLAAQLPAHEINLICVDTLREVIARESNANPVNRLVADNLAYVIYTSGSTGQPKGVQITQNALASFLNSMRQRPGLTSDDVFLAIATISFDISTLEIFLPLIMGTRLVLADRDAARDAARLLSIIEREAVTIVQATPSTWQLMLEAGWASRGALKILSGGEALTNKMAGELLRRSNSVWNVYGPTETTVWSHVARLAAAHETQLIGFPVAGAQACVLDEDLQPVPIGVAGEIYIGGIGVARGYINSPALTAERFLPNPFSSEPGARWYRTGDLARRRSDGNVEFLGRSDHQVKIRGMRIELGEIEAVLAQHEGVRRCVVVAREDVPGQRQLVAYVLTTPDEPAVSATELRSYLKEKLPEYMVPAFFVSLTELPLTPNGKVDRRALPAPERAEAEQSFAAPRTVVEELLVAIWRQVLQLDRVGIHDNFFHLGGHSLLATQVLSRLRQTFGVELPLRALFEFPSVAGLAQQVESRLHTGLELKELPLIGGKRPAGLLPLSFAQQRLWIVEQLTRGSAVYNLPVAVRLKGELNVSALTRSLNEIVRRHEALRTTFALVEGNIVQLIAPSLELSLPVVDLPELPDVDREAEAQRLANEFMQAPFDLSSGPLLRAQLMRLHPEEHIALFVMHHIISDGWSLGVLVRELATLYDAFARELPSPLPELPVQYADFAVWQRAWLQGDRLAAQLDYWRKKLGPQPPELALPLDRPRPQIQTYNGAHVSFTVAAETQRELNVLSRREGVTLFMTLLAAFQTLLYRYSSQEDIVVGTDVANRNRAETEHVIGFFVNMLVLRTDLSGNPTFRELLARVREVALGAYAHQDLPFDRLVDELEPERDPSRNPLFQAVFVLHNYPSSELKLPGITLSPFRFESHSSQFDLILSMSEGTDNMVGTVSYNTDLFAASTITEMVRRFQTLLQTIVADPDQHIADIRLTATDGLTGADFPRAEISQKDFENLLAQLTASQS